MKNEYTKNINAILLIAIISIGTACGGKTETKANSTMTAENKSTALLTRSAASAVVKDVYDDAMRRNCAAIPAKLTESFRKEVGASKDALDALCNAFTDSGNLAGFEIKGEDLKGDAGTIKVALTYKDGKKEEKTESVKKSGTKWLLDS